MKLLVTRPAPDGERTAAALRAGGHEVWLAPLTRIAPVPAQLGSGPWAAVLITSANAARALEIHTRRQELIGIPLIAVGDHSATAARHAGFADVIASHGAAKDLVDLAAALHGGKGRPLLYLAGADRATDLVADLAAVAVPVEMHVIYQAVAVPDLAPDVAALLRRGGLDGVLHFSRRSAAMFLEAADRADIRAAALGLAHFCLSARVAEPLAAAGAQTIRIASHPTEDSLLRLVDSP